MSDVKGLYEDKFGYSLNGVKFSVTRGAPPSLAELEQTSDKLIGTYADSFGYSLVEAVVAKSSLW